MRRSLLGRADGCTHARAHTTHTTHTHTHTQRVRDRDKQRERDRETERPPAHGGDRALYEARVGDEIDGRRALRFRLHLSVCVSLSLYLSLSLCLLCLFCLRLCLFCPLCLLCPPRSPLSLRSPKRSRRSWRSADPRHARTLRAVQCRVRPVEECAVPTTSQTDARDYAVQVVARENSVQGIRQ